MQRQKDNASRPTPFMLVDELDNTTGLEGLSPTVTISKPGTTSFSAAAGSVTERGNGLYDYNQSAGEVDTLGTLLFHAEASGAAPVDVRVEIVTVDVHGVYLANNSDGAKIATAALQPDNKPTVDESGVILADNRDGEAIESGGGATEAKQDQILAKLAAGTPTIAPVINSGKHVVTVRGDDYTADSPHGALEWSPDDDGDWPDLTDATVAFTSRLASTDAVEVEVEGAVVNPAGPGKMIRVELSTEETLKLTPGKKLKSNKFDVQVTLASGKIWTPIRGGDPTLRSGGHTVVEDQTRA